MYGTTQREQDDALGNREYSLVESISLILAKGVIHPLARTCFRWLMAYRLPNFNLLCNIATPDVPNVAAIPSGSPRIINQACALVYGRRVGNTSSGGTSDPGVPVETINILLPKLTDVRGPQDTISFDMIECPAGSGRWYWATFVDDIGKGYGNEHRTASVLALVASWVAPYP